MFLALRLLPAILSALVLGAHFLRSGGAVVAVACALFPLILLAHRIWAVRAVQAFLVFAAGTWGWTAFQIAGQRMEASLPWARMALILGAVGLLAVAAALLLGARKTRQRLVRAP